MNDREFLDNLKQKRKLFEAKEDIQRIMFLAGRYEGLSICYERKEFVWEVNAATGVLSSLIRTARDRLDKNE